jgi:hypothetical protein
MGSRFLTLPWHDGRRATGVLPWPEADLSSGVHQTSLVTAGSRVIREMAPIGGVTLSGERRLR